MSPLLDGTGLQARVGGQDVTAHTTGLTFSAVDPGGYETCTLNLAGVEHVDKGATVAVFDGTQDVWWGRVEEPGQRIENGQVAFNVSAVGAGAALKDEPYSCIYMDRDLSQWTSPPREEQLRLLQTGQSMGSFSTVTGPQGDPTLMMERQAPWTTSMRVEAWYDAGPIATVALVHWYYFGAGTGGFGGASNVVSIHGVDQAELSTVQETTGDLETGGGAGRDFARFAAPHRYVVLDWAWFATVTGDAQDRLAWARLAAVGPHGLTIREPDNTTGGGLWPSDIARHALKQAGAQILPGVIETASGYLVTHSVYREPTAPEKVIDDMAKLMGWHWGVWGPASILDDTPRLHFRAPPQEATATVSRTIIGDLDLTDRLSDVYDSVQVAYTDAAGTPGYETVEIANPNMLDGLHRQAQAQIGLSTAAAARAFGRFWLLLSQRTVRAAGSGTLPATVSAPGGGSRRALTLKPGLDRLRITDLPSTGQNLLETDTRRFDTFRLSRTETTVQAGGAPVTRVEFDSGANLLDTLQTRLDTATQVAVGS